MRLFVALLLEEPVLEELKRIQESLRAADSLNRVRWVGPDGFHLTLQFLGEVTPQNLPPLQDALAASLEAAPVPSLSLSGLGAFPNWRRPRVLWLGLESVGPHLESLHTLVLSATQPLGWEPESRPYQPHLTLGRVRDSGARQPAGDPDSWTRIRATSVRRLPVLPHRHVALMRSQLSPAGARYEVLRGWTLPSQP